MCMYLLMTEVENVCVLADDKKQKMCVYLLMTEVENVCKLAEDRSRKCVCTY